MADIEFKDWREFGLQFGDIIGQQRLEVVQRVLKHAEKIVYCDDAGIVGVYISASCKKEVQKNISQLTDVGWSTSVNPAPKNGVVVTLTIVPIPDISDDEVADTTPTISTFEEDTIMTTQTTNTQAQFVTLEQMTAAMNSAFATNVVKITTDAAEAATKAAIAAAGGAPPPPPAARRPPPTAVNKLKADIVNSATELTTRAATAAEAAAKTELEKFGVQLKAAEAANKTLVVKVEALESEAKNLSMKAKKAKAKAESGFLDDYTTTEKVVGAVVIGAVGYIVWDKFIKN